MNKNFIFKSTGADLQKIINSNLLIQKNVLYLTYQVDKILKILREEQTDKGLQTQVDKYFTQDGESIPPPDDKDLE